MAVPWAVANLWLSLTILIHGHLSLPGAPRPRQEQHSTPVDSPTLDLLIASCVPGRRRFPALYGAMEYLHMRTYPAEAHIRLPPLFQPAPARSIVNRRLFAAASLGS